MLSNGTRGHSAIGSTVLAQLGWAVFDVCPCTWQGLRFRGQGRMFGGQMQRKKGERLKHTKQRLAINPCFTTSLNLSCTVALEAAVRGSHGMSHCWWMHSTREPL